MGRRQRAGAIKLDEHLGDLAAHEVAGQTADAQGRRAMGTGRTAHDGSEDVVEDTYFHARGLTARRLASFRAGSNHEPPEDRANLLADAAQGVLGDRLPGDFL